MFMWWLLECFQLISQLNFFNIFFEIFFLQDFYRLYFSNKLVFIPLKSPRKKHLIWHFLIKTVINPIKVHSKRLQTPLHSPDRKPTAYIAIAIILDYIFISPNLIFINFYFFPKWIIIGGAGEKILR